MTSEDTGAIVEIQGDAPIIQYQSLEDVIALAEKRVVAYDRLKIFALRATRASDWVLNPGPTGPKPYLQESGALKVARVFGVKISNTTSNRIERVTEDGVRYFIEEWEGDVSLPGGVDSIRAFGARSSLDPFFQYQIKAGDPASGRLPSYIDDADVKKAAKANFHANGVTQLLGLRGMTIEDLIAAGLNTEEMLGIDYKGKSARPKTGDASELSLAEIAEKTAKLMKSIVGNEPKALADFLEERSAFEGKDGTKVSGKRSFKGLTIGRARTTYGRLKEDVASKKLEVKFDEDGEPLDGKE